MRVMPVNQNFHVCGTNEIGIGDKKLKNITSDYRGLYAGSILSINGAGLTSPVNYINITFTGGDKNINQFISYAPENKRYKANAYNQGGLGVVAEEAPQNWRIHEHADVRDASPYHSFNNTDGGVRVAIIQRDADGKIIRELPQENFVSAGQNESLEEVAKRLNLGNKELSYVSQNEPSVKGGKSTFILLEDTGVKGSFERVSDTELDKLKTVTYKIFRSKDAIDLAKGMSDAAPEVAERNSVYFVHTEDLARFKNAYGIDAELNGTVKDFGGAYGAYGTYGSFGTKEELKDVANTKELKAAQNGVYGTYGTNASVLENAGEVRHVSTNVFYADNARALVEAMPQLNTEAHGNFNPANWWLHDRPAFMAMSAIADKSSANIEYYNGGIKAHGTFHNPGRDYQGWLDNPFEFFRMVATPEDVAALSKHPQVNELKVLEKNWNNIQHGSPEYLFVRQIFDPYLKGFIDDFKTYNITMTPVAAVKTNPKNFSAGTVSVNYGKEMKSSTTKDIASGMTQSLSEIETHDIVNGSTPANLRLNDKNADFCRKGFINGLTKLKDGFTPYEYKFTTDETGKIISDNLDEVLSAKTKNTKWLLNLMGDAYDKGGRQALEKIFFSDEQIHSGSTVIGHLSSFKEGDKLFMGWGRPDKQKGYPTTFGALQEYFEFLKDKNIPDVVKQRTKFLVGAGVWHKEAEDYGWIEDIISKIEKLDGGKYKGNACYVNGFFPNRLVGCASWTIFTSRFEPCGITPLESFASGTPCISIATGGAPDFINESRGFISKNPYLLSIEKLEEITGEKIKLTGEGWKDSKIIDGLRWKNASKEMKDCILLAMSTSENELKEILKEQLGHEIKLTPYEDMVRNAITQKIDWHENAEFNGGRTANQRYMEEVFERSSGMESRSKTPMKRLVGKFGIATKEIEKNVKETISNIASQSENVGTKVVKKLSKTSKVLMTLGGGAVVLGSIATIKKDRSKKNDKLA